VNRTIYPKQLCCYLCHILPVHVLLLDQVPESTGVLSDIQLQLQKRYNVLVTSYLPVREYCRVTVSKRLGFLQPYYIVNIVVGYEPRVSPGRRGFCLMCGQASVSLCHTITAESKDLGLLLGLPTDAHPVQPAHPPLKYFTADHSRLARIFSFIHLPKPQHLNQHRSQ
jgi:hypothetical protein